MHVYIEIRSSVIVANFIEAIEAANRALLRM